jgi:hypothetical protein
MRFHTTQIRKKLNKNDCMGEKQGQEIDNRIATGDLKLNGMAIKRRIAPHRDSTVVKRILT